MENIQNELAQLTAEVKTLSKMIRKIKSKMDDPDGEKSKKRAANNGFNRPQTVSPELSKFLELKKDEQISRSAVTKAINKYATDNNLKHPDNGRVLILDDKLKTILKPPEGTQVTFLNLQKYLSVHYIKQEA